MLNKDNDMDISDILSVYIPVNQFLDATATALILIDQKGNILTTNKEFKNIHTNLEPHASIFNLVSESTKRKLLKNLAEKLDCFYVVAWQSNISFTNIVFKKIIIAERICYLGTAIKKSKTDHNSLLQQLINNMPDNIFVKDTHSKFVIANHWIARIIGVESTKMLIGRTDFDFFPKKLAQKYYNDELKIIQTGRPLLNEQEKVLVNGRIRWYSTTKVPLYDEHGNIAGIVGVGRDITKNVREKKALEKAKKEAEIADHLKLTFLANLSHEIRTPLNGILGFSQFLRQKQHSEEKQNKYLDIILANGKSLLMLINDIIDISMIESNQVSIKKRPFRLNELIDQAYANYVYQLSQKNKKIKLVAHKALLNEEDIIVSDDFRINQIMGNLISNAIKFTERGKIEFGYTLDQNKIEFYIADTGIGIKKEQQEEIFKRFRQADESMTRNYGGTGLGLSICRGLVYLLNGKIWVKSEPGQGSTFYFTIPFEKHPESKESTVKEDGFK
jgi:two-component system, sensor histidine kinase and response regulator